MREHSFFLTQIFTFFSIYVDLPQQSKNLLGIAHSKSGIAHKKKLTVNFSAYNRQENLGSANFRFPK